MNEIHNDKKRKLSFIIPIKDEEATIRILAFHILDVVRKMGDKYEVEIIFIDDGSRDKSWNIIKQLADSDNKNFIAIRLRRNFGKATAFAIGFSIAKGDIVFTMDGDLQDDPNEIPKFVHALDSDEEVDLISGWKRKRKDSISKTLPSVIFNLITSRLTGIALHDFNCGFKAYRREVVECISLYGELHRYIPVLAHDLGFRTGEIEITHHSRKHGNSKYGAERFMGGFLDLLTILATTRWLTKPAHLFGSIGVFTGFTGVSMLGYIGILWFLNQRPVGNRPLLLLGIMLCILSVQLISLGIIAEFFIKLKNPREIFNLVAEKINVCEKK